MGGQVAMFLGGLLAGFALVAGVMSWRRRRRGRLPLVAALGALGVAGMAFGLDAYGVEAPGLRHLRVLAFAASGPAIVAFRGRFLPMSRRARHLVWIVVAASVVPTLFRSPPAADLPALGGWRGTVVVTVWMALVLEAGVQFLVTARRRPAVQKARLRLFGAGFVMMAMATASYWFGMQLLPGDSYLLVSQAIGALTVATLYHAIVAPPWLRARWAASEEAAHREALENLLAIDPDPETVARVVVEWAARLVGADGAKLVDDENNVLAEHRWPSIHLQQSLPSMARVRARRIIDVDGSNAMVLVPMRVGDAEAEGVLAVVTGNVTPILGQPEVRRLEQFAAVAGAFLERAGYASDLDAVRRRSSAMLSAISDLGEGIAIGDGNGISYVNDALCLLSGYAREELLGKSSIVELVEPRDRVLAERRAYELRVGERRSDRFALSIRTKQGDLRRVDVAIREVELERRRQFVAVVRDVTSLERALEREQRRADQLDALAHVAETIAGTLDVDTILKSVVESARQIIRCRHAVIGVLDDDGRMERLVHVGPIDHDLDEAIEIDLAALAAGHPAGRVAMEALGVPALEDGFLAVPIRRGGTTLGLLYLTHRRGAAPFDEVDRATAASLAAFAAQALAIARRYAGELERRVAVEASDALKSGLLAALSHDLRTPIAALAGIAETLLLRNEELDNDRRADLLSRVLRSARRMDRMIADLLDIERDSFGLLELDRRDVDVIPFIDRVVREMDVPRSIPVTVHGESRVAQLDPAKLERVIENLVINAAKHAPRGTEVRVQIMPEPGAVTIAIDDDGQGVPPDERERIFAAFAQAGPAPQRSKGVGLGLHVCSILVNAHGGRIWVEDSATGGASFRCWIPDIAGPRVVDLSEHENDPVEAAAAQDALSEDAG